MNPSQGFTLSVISDSQAGSSISSAGDINGDGISDIIIGAYAANSGAGAAYVIYGAVDYDTAQKNLEEKLKKEAEVTETDVSIFGNIVFTAVAVVMIFINEHYQAPDNPTIA